MAEEIKKKNRVGEAIQHEWKYENLILVILALFALELGVLLLDGDLVINNEAPIIGKYWKAFAWVLVGIGAISLIFGVSSFYRPSFEEIKHITGLKKSEFFANILTVVVFSAILAGLFVGFDSLIELFMKLFN